MGDCRGGYSVAGRQILRRFISAGFLVAVVLMPLFAYVYVRGVVDGVEHYRHSKQFVLTLEGMYRMGLMDGCTDDHLCDLAGLGAEEEGGRR